VLPSRLDRYESAMLDMICLTGEAGWARLSPAPSSTGAPASLVPATPVALFLQEHAAVWQTLRAPREAPLPLTDDARVVLDTLRARGALFFGALASACGFDADRLRQAIGTLVACGLATSDGFAGLRALVRAARGRFAPNDRRTKFAGRWAAIATPSDEDTRSRVSGIDEAREEAVAAQAWTLLRRYGIVCRRVLTRETNVLPWRELVRVYRRLEARGEVRGGRFVAGLSGEQFALPEAVERMREVRRSAPDDALVTISAADPLNLAGIVTAGERIRAIGRSRIVYRNGAPLAVLEGDTVRELAPIDPSIAADVSRALRPRRASAVLV
jgi:ATP-dependent Lhr-like helicase